MCPCHYHYAPPGLRDLSIPLKSKKGRKGESITLLQIELDLCYQNQNIRGCKGLRNEVCLIVLSTRASENFWGCLAQSPPKNLGQIAAALAISGIFEQFSPGPNGSKVGRQIALNSPTGLPTSEPFGPGENLSEWPEIARALRNWPKYFKSHWAENP